MKVYTKTGDDGTTSLGRQGRVGKDHPCLQCYGDLDELNSHIGMLKEALLYQHRPTQLGPYMTHIQDILFDLGASVSYPSGESIDEFLDKEVLDLEKRIDEMTSAMTPLRRFILPGGGRASSQAHVVRSVCRRAERSFITCVEATPAGKRYINRLSDFFFTLARHLSLGEEDLHVDWKKREKPQRVV